MPKYSTIKTYRSGFYTNKNDGRVYSAEDMRKPYDVIYTDGIKPDADGMPNDNLKVSVHSPMEIVSKADVYEAYKGYVSFLKNIK